VLGALLLAGRACAVPSPAGRPAPPQKPGTGALGVGAVLKVQKSTRTREVARCVRDVSLWPPGAIAVGCHKGRCSGCGNIRVVCCSPAGRSAPQTLEGRSTQRKISSFDKELERRDRIRTKLPRALGKAVTMKASGDDGYLTRIRPRRRDSTRPTIYCCYKSSKGR